MSYAIPTKIEAPKEFRDRLVRYVLAPSGTLAADPTSWSYIDGNSVEITFGGTATNGDYVITIDPVAASVASIPITTTRAGGAPATNTNLATQAVTETNTLLAVAAAGADPATVLSTYVKSASSSGAVLTLLLQRNAPPFRITYSAPAPGTLSGTPSDEFPIVFGASGYGPIAGTKSRLEVLVIPVSSARVPLDPNSATIDLTVRRMVERRALGITDGAPVAVASSVTATIDVGTPAYVESASGWYAFSLANLTGTITGLEGFEIWVREVTY